MNNVKVLTCNPAVVQDFTDQEKKTAWEETWLPIQGLLSAFGSIAFLTFFLAWCYRARVGENRAEVEKEVRPAATLVLQACGSGANGHGRKSIGCNLRTLRLRFQVSLVGQTFLGPNVCSLPRWSGTVRSLAISLALLSSDSVASRGDTLIHCRGSAWS